MFPVLGKEKNNKNAENVSKSIAHFFEMLLNILRTDYRVRIEKYNKIVLSYLQSVILEFYTPKTEKKSFI